MFIKKTVCILMFISCSIFGFSQNDISFYDEFIRINNILGTQQYVSLQKMLVAEDNKFVDEKSAITIFSGESQVTSLSGTYFLSTPQGYWILNGKLKSPLKISGNFQIDEMEIQDILRIDYEKNYKKAVDDNEQGLLLERVSKKMAYPYVYLKEKSLKQYEITFMDKNKTPIKTLIYKTGFVDGIEYFSDIEIHNHLFNTSTIKRYITSSLSKIKIPNVLFSNTQFQNLIPYLEIK